MTTRKLYRRSAKEADRLLWISVAVGTACGFFTAIATENMLAALAVISVPLYSLVRRVLKGPPVGAPLLELAEDMLVLRNPLLVPPKVDRIAVQKLHSVCYRGEEGRRFFDFLDQEGILRSIGPFERMPDLHTVADWFAETLPELQFRIDVTAMPAQSSRPSVL